MTIDELLAWAYGQDDPDITEADLIAAYEHLGRHAASACWTNPNHLFIRQLLLACLRTAKEQPCS